MKSTEIPARSSVVLISLKTVLVAIVFTVVALFVLAAFVTYGNISESAVSACVTAATIICVFASGYVSSGIIGRKGWLTGLIAGIVYVLIIFLTGWLALGDFSVSAHTFKMLVISVFSGIIGGIAGVNFKRKRKARR